MTWVSSDTDIVKRFIKSAHNASGRNYAYMIERHDVTSVRTCLFRADDTYNECSMPVEVMA